SEAGREEILAGGLVVERTGAVPEEQIAGLFLEEIGGCGVPGRSCPVDHQAEAEGRLVVLADADGMGELGQPGAEVPHGRLGQWLERFGPALRLRRVPFLELGGELQQPGETVW